MTGLPSARPERASERGMALVAALLLMMVMSGLAIALLASGRIETAMGDNEELYAGARAASEAGLNHTAAIILQLTADPVYSLDTLINGPDALADPATDSASVNADNGQVSHLLGGTAPWAVAAGSNYTYDVRLLDDDDPALKGGVPFTSVELTAMGASSALNAEDGLRFNDVNGRLVIRSTGFGPRGTQATLEQMLVPIEMPALLVNGNLTMAGNTRVLGDQGSVHANGTLRVQNTSVFVAKDATSTGNLDHSRQLGSGRTGIGRHADYSGAEHPRLQLPDHRRLLSARRWPHHLRLCGHHPGLQRGYGREQLPRRDSL